MKLKQTERVLKAARQAGEDGICQVDFLPPYVMDGGAPITRLAARINDLKEQGFRFRSGGERHSTKVYVLEDAA